MLRRTAAEFDADFALVQKREFVLPDHLMIHDWTFTDKHYVLLGNRIKLDVPGTARIRHFFYSLRG